MTKCNIQGSVFGPTVVILKNSRSGLWFEKLLSYSSKRGVLKVYSSNLVNYDITEMVHVILVFEGWSGLQETFSELF